MLRWLWLLTWYTGLLALYFFVFPTTFLYHPHWIFPALHLPILLQNPSRNGSPCQDTQQVLSGHCKILCNVWGVAYDLRALAYALLNTSNTNPETPSDDSIPNIRNFAYDNNQHCDERASETDSETALVVTEEGIPSHTATLASTPSSNAITPPYARSE